MGMAVQASVMAGKARRQRGLSLIGLLFWAVGSFVKGFVVDGFWAGFLGAIVYSLISWAAAALLVPGKK